MGNDGDFSYLVVGGVPIFYVLDVGVHAEALLFVVVPASPFQDVLNDGDFSYLVMGDVPIFYVLDVGVHAEALLFVVVPASPLQDVPNDGDFSFYHLQDLYPVWGVLSVPLGNHLWDRVVCEFLIKNSPLSNL